MAVTDAELEAVAEEVKAALDGVEEQLPDRLCMTFLSSVAMDVVCRACMINDGEEAEAIVWQLIAGMAESAREFLERMRAAGKLRR